MEEEPAERVTTHHRSVGTEGLRRRGWKEEGWGGEPWRKVALMEGTCPIISLLKSTKNPSFLAKEIRLY